MLGGLRACRGIHHFAAPVIYRASLVTQTDQGDPREVPLSNRRGTGSISEPPPGQSALFGVDRVSVAFPVAWYEADRSAWTSESVFAPGTRAESWSRGVSMDLNESARAFVGVKYVPATGQVWGKVETNPSRVVDPGGHSLAPAESVWEALEEAVDAASSVLVPGVPSVGAMKLRRLDVARDFHDVSRPEFIVRGLGPVHRPWARRNLVHFDPSRNGAQTLMVGSGAGVVRLYDKDAETGGHAPGVLRWEAECRAAWVQNYGGMTTVDDLDAESVDRLGTDRWEWSAMGQEVSALESVVETVMRSGLSYARQQRLIGMLAMHACGADVRMSKESAAAYRKEIRRLGISVDPGSLLGDAPPVSARLDLETASEVLCVR